MSQTLPWCVQLGASLTVTYFAAAASRPRPAPPSWPAYMHRRPILRAPRASILSPLAPPAISPHLGLFEGRRPTQRAAVRACWRWWVGALHDGI